MEEQLTMLYPLTTKVKTLESEISRLEGKLEKAETIIAFQKKLSEMLGINLEQKEERQKMLINATENLAENIGVSPACEGMGVARSTLYYKRTRKQHPDVKIKAKPSQGA